MGLFKDIANTFNGTSRKRYDETHSAMMDILNNDNNSSILYSGYNLNADQKLLTLLFINGCFNGLVLMHNINNGDMDIQDSLKKASGISQLFLEDKMSWSRDDVYRTVKAVDSLLYQNPQIAQNIVSMGMGVVLNLNTSPNLAKMMGYDDISREQGIQILEEFFTLLKET